MIISWSYGGVAQHQDYFSGGTQIFSWVVCPEVLLSAIIFKVSGRAKDFVTENRPTSFKVSGRDIDFIVSERV